MLSVLIALCALTAPASRADDAPSSVVDTPPSDGAQPAPEPHTPTPPPDSAWIEGLDAEFGKGVTMSSPGGAFSLTMRGRLQFRGSVQETANEDEPVDLSFQIRRARLVFLGELFRPDLQFYIQLGFSPTDMEPDLLVPLRDAALSWTAFRDFGVRIGQMKVPFNRERVISSSALQLTDRSIVNGELTLDRDVGVQVYSNDLFGLGGVLAYQAGVFGGDGRNRINEDMGLLYVARMQVQPFGFFDDGYSEADLVRSPLPRISFGAGVAFNHQARRQKSTHGTFYEHSTYDEAHAEADLIVKWWGFSLQSEVLLRQAVSPTQVLFVDGEPSAELPRSGSGFMVQGGYLFPIGLEIAARFAMIEPLIVEFLRRSESALGHERELAGAMGWYIMDHNLKVQGEVARLFDEDWMNAKHVGRVQVQVFF